MPQAPHAVARPGAAERHQEAGGEAGTKDRDGGERDDPLPERRDVAIGRLEEMAAGLQHQELRRLVGAAGQHRAEILGAGIAHRLAPRERRGQRESGEGDGAQGSYALRPPEQLEECPGDNQRASEIRRHVMRRRQGGDHDERNRRDAALIIVQARRQHEQRRDEHDAEALVGELRVEDEEGRGAHVDEAAAGGDERAARQALVGEIEQRDEQQAADREQGDRDREHAEPRQRAERRRDELEPGIARADRQQRVGREQATAFEDVLGGRPVQELVVVDEAGRLADHPQHVERDGDGEDRLEPPSRRGRRRQGAGGARNEAERQRCVEDRHREGVVMTRRVSCERRDDECGCHRQYRDRTQPAGALFTRKRGRRRRERRGEAPRDRLAGHHQAAITRR